MRKVFLAAVTLPLLLAQAVRAHPGTGIVVGGVVVAPRASELIFPVALAVSQKLTVDQVASAFTIYPSLSGSVAEAARQLHVRA